LETFGDLTFKQIELLLKTINKALRRDLAQQAKLHGMSLRNELEPLEFTDEEQADNQKQAESALERLNKRHKERTGK